MIEVIGDARRTEDKRTVGFYTRTRQRGTRIQVTQVLIFFCIIFFCCSLIMLYVAFAMFVYAEAIKRNAATEKIRGNHIIIKQEKALLF